MLFPFKDILVRAVWTSHRARRHDATPDSSREVHQGAPPSSKLCASTQVRRPGREDANLPTCSVHAVSHDYDGLLRARPCRFIAPCIRPWSSPGFTEVGARRLRSRIPQNAGAPLEAFPSLSAEQQSRAMDKSTAFHPLTVPSRRCSSARLHVAIHLDLLRSTSGC
jgi:hypothetical protein